MKLRNGSMTTMEMPGNKFSYYFIIIITILFLVHIRAIKFSIL